MTDREDFLAWIHGALYEAELALHNGDPGPRRALWSRNEPVSVLGAWRNANGQREVDELFTVLGDSFLQLHLVRRRGAGVRRDRRHGVHRRTGAHLRLR